MYSRKDTITEKTCDRTRHTAEASTWELNWRPFSLQAGMRSTEPGQEREFLL